MAGTATLRVRLEVKRRMDGERMKRTALLVTMSALALSLVATSDVSAETRRKKQGLFENVFGVPQREEVRRRKANRGEPVKARRGSGKWQDNQFSGSRSDRQIAREATRRANEDDVRIINGQRGEAARKQKQGKPRNVIQVADSDPEGDPGFGMGNLTYMAPKLVPVTGLQIKEVRPADAAAGLIHDAFTATEPTIRATAEVRDAVVALYRQQNFRPMWTEGGVLSARGASVLRVLSQADAEGLEASAYLPASMETFDQTPPAHDPAAMARLDIELSIAALNFARDASGGRFDPRKLSLYHDVTPQTVPAATAAKVLAYSPYPAEYLQALHPVHPAYAAMKTALAELRKSEREGIIANPIPDGNIVKKGKSDARIPAVRDRLAELGYAAQLPEEGNPELLDAELSIQMRLFQKASGIKASGALGPQTVAALNANHASRDIPRLLNNIERLRWLPKNLGSRHVFVNQAAYRAWVMDSGKEVWSTRVIVGRPYTQTNVFHDEMETVVFNPSWGVPPSIIANEYLPKLRRDPGYLDRIGFKVVNAKGKVVSSRSVSWASYGSKVPFGILQPPGGENALGEIKFLFPNTHNIYMHDTPSRNLFEKDERAFSHGCVRVQNPREFASVLLGWSAEEVASHIGTPQSENVKLAQKIPVHLTYFTAWPDETGKMHYFADIYGRDKTMENARSATVLAKN